MRTPPSHRLDDIRLIAEAATAGAATALAEHSRSGPSRMNKPSSPQSGAAIGRFQWVAPEPSQTSRLTGTDRGNPGAIALPRRAQPQLERRHRPAARHAARSARPPRPSDRPVLHHPDPPARHQHERRGVRQVSKVRRSWRDLCGVLAATGARGLAARTFKTWSKAVVSDGRRRCCSSRSARAHAACHPTSPLRLRPSEDRLDDVRHTAGR